MTDEKRKPAFNFKRLYNQKYGDIAHLHKNRQYTPEQVFIMAQKYFEWAEENAIKASETASFRGQVFEGRVHKPRVFTWAGFRLFCGLAEATIHNWKRADGYREVMDFVATVIDEQKYQLAVNGIISPSIIGKELGIDKQLPGAVADSSHQITDEAMKRAVESVIDKL